METPDEEKNFPQVEVPDHTNSTSHGQGSGQKLEVKSIDTRSASPSQKRPYRVPVPKRKGRRKDDSLLAVLCQWIVDHQIGLAANLLALLALTHLCFPRARRHTRKFFRLSYYNPDTDRYKLGWDDLPLIFYWIVVFTGLRAGMMDYVLTPLAQLAGIGKKKARVRFAEQAWIFLYYSAFWSIGMYLMYNSAYWFDLKEMWTGWPDREMDSLFKWYYLVQFAFWLQQILVVNIEERRKDHWQMFAHHIITCTLIFTSYGYHQTKSGNVILCLMDIVDIIFPFAKMLKYLKFHVACDIAFGTFMVTWFITRHILYFMVVRSLYLDSPVQTAYGCYYGSNADLHGPIEPPDQFGHLLQPFTDPQGLVCWTEQSMLSFVGTLLALQVILLIWFGMIIRVAAKVIKGGKAEDSRSDDEDEEGEDREVDEKDRTIPPSHEAASVEEDTALIVEEVTVDAINLCRNNNKRYRKSGVAASGITIPSDTKDLLGRIGCDKGLS